MTVKELSQLYWLNLEVGRDEERLAELEAQMGPTSPTMNDMPHSARVAGSALEDLALAIIELKERIAAKQAQCMREKKRLEDYISGIEDSLTRQIFELRFVECVGWDDVGYVVHLTADGAKKRCYRYLKTEGKKK